MMHLEIPTSTVYSNAFSKAVRALLSCSPSLCACCCRLEILELNRKLQSPRAVVDVQHASTHCPSVLGLDRLQVVSTETVLN